MQDPTRPPQGTIALLFTDIEGSTRLATRLGEAWNQVLADHHALVGGAITAEGGFVDGTEGDAFFATFMDARAAVRAAVAGQRALHAHEWPAQVGELKVRMGLHVGYVERRDTGYVGLEVHRAARVAAAAHGGQLLLTTTARELVGDMVPTEALGSHRLKDFPSAVQLFCAVIDGRGAAAFPPPRTEEVRPTNLPAGAPVLIGRDEDLARVQAALEGGGERVVTLTGRGGAGKTTLAMVVAAAVLDDFPGGVWLARLANLQGPEQALGEVASAVGAAAGIGDSATEAIITRLRTRGPTLLVLDNLEHVLGVVPAIAELLDALGELRILITSQAPARLADELCVPLDALDDEAAIALLERVARRRGARLPDDAPSRDALRDVVHLLDGLPLALELAAARLPLLSPPQLRDRLRASHDVLSDDRSDRPERHRSLAATVDWTLSLLDPAPVALFDRMGAFAGPVELEEIEAVAGGDGLDVLAELARLLDVALLRRVEAGDGRVRFGLPEALRQIAASRLDAAPDGAQWRQAHARRQLEIIWAARAIFVPHAIYGKAIDADPEIAAALRWTRAVGDPMAARLAVARAGLLADIGQLREALTVLEPVLADPPDDPDVHAHALWARSWALTASGRTAEAVAPAEQAVELAQDPACRVLALNMRGLAYSFAGDLEPAVRDSSEASAMARGLDPAILSGTLMLEAQARQFAGQLDRVVELLAEAERVGRPVDAEFLWRRHTVLGDLAALSGDPPAALEHYADSLEEAQVRGNEVQVVFDLLGSANALGALGADAESVEVGAMAETQIAELGGPEASGVDLVGQQDSAAARERLDEDRVRAVEEQARGVPAAQRVTRACQLARTVAAGARCGSV